MEFKETMVPKVENDAEIFKVFFILNKFEKYHLFDFFSLSFQIYGQNVDKDLKLIRSPVCLSTRCLFTPEPRIIKQVLVRDFFMKPQHLLQCHVRNKVLIELMPVAKSSNNLAGIEALLDLLKEDLEGVD